MPLVDNLTSYYKFDESSGNASDSFGSNTLTNNGSTSYASGKINNGIDLESSSSQYFSKTSQPFDSTSGTICAWVKLESLSSTLGYGQSIFSTSTNVGVAGVDFTIRASDDKIGVFFGTGSQEATGGSALTTGTFYHVACTWTTAFKKVYLNGSLVNTNSNAQTQTAGSTTAYVGTTASATSRYFDGIIDELGIWSRALSDSEISQIYASGGGVQYPFEFYISDTQGSTDTIDIKFDLTVSDTQPSDDTATTKPTFSSQSKPTSVWSNQQKP